MNQIRHARCPPKKEHNLFTIFDMGCVLVPAVKESDYCLVQWFINDRANSQHEPYKIYA